MLLIKKSAASITVAVLVGIPVLYLLSLYTAAWCNRWRAERLLTAIKGLRVGVTTQAEYLKAIGPLVHSSECIRDGVTDQPLFGAYGIATLPEWMYDSALPLRQALGEWAVVDGTVFSVQPTFRDDRLVALRVDEMQGEGHPFGGVVTIHAGQVPHLYPNDSEVFTGYSGSPLVAKGRVIYTHVVMDDRATPEERRRALDFRFDCFTAFHLCKDGRQLLDPVTTDR